MKKRISFSKVTTKEEQAAIDQFFIRWHERQEGSPFGYRAYYAAVAEGDEPLVDRIVAAAKICPLHTASAAKMFAGKQHGHVYVLQRLAALHPPKNLLSRFLGWVLKQVAQDGKVRYVATYACTGSFNPFTLEPHLGTIYRVLNAEYFGKSKGGRIEGYVQDGRRHSMRSGSRTLRKKDIPSGARIIRSAPKYRFCWPVGTTRPQRWARRLHLRSRPEWRKWEPVWVQPRLFARLIQTVRNLWRILSNANH